MAGRRAVPDEGEVGVASRAERGLTAVQVIGRGGAARADGIVGHAGRERDRGKPLIHMVVDGRRDAARRHVVDRDVHDGGGCLGSFIVRGYGRDGVLGGRWVGPGEGIDAGVERAGAEVQVGCAVVGVKLHTGHRAVDVGGRGGERNAADGRGVDRPAGRASDTHAGRRRRPHPHGNPRSSINHVHVDQSHIGNAAT